MNVVNGNFVSINANFYYCYVNETGKIVIEKGRSNLSGILLLNRKFNVIVNFISKSLCYILVKKDVTGENMSKEIEFDVIFAEWNSIFLKNKIK